MKYWWLIFVFPVAVGVIIMLLALVPNSPLTKAAEQLVCPAGSTFKVTSSDATWYDDGLTRQGTGYSFDCVNPSGRHVENHVETVFTLLLLTAILSPFVIVFWWVFAPKKTVKYESMYDQQ